MAHAVGGLAEAEREEVDAWIKAHRKMWLDGQLPKPIVVKKDLYEKLVIRAEAPSEPHLVFRGVPVVPEKDQVNG